MQYFYILAYLKLITNSLVNNCYTSIHGILSEKDILRQYSF